MLMVAGAGLSRGGGSGKRDPSDNSFFNFNRNYQSDVGNNDGIKNLISEITLRVKTVQWSNALLREERERSRIAARRDDQSLGSDSKIQPRSGNNTNLPSLPYSPPKGGSLVCNQNRPEDCFRKGYQAYRGNPLWEDHFVNDVLTCEGSQWEGYHGNYYWSRAQFSPDTWASVKGALHISDSESDSPYWTGAAVAWWSNKIIDSGQGSTAGWPTCWWRGTVP